MGPDRIFDQSILNTPFTTSQVQGDRKGLKHEEYAVEPVVWVLWGDTRVRRNFNFNAPNLFKELAYIRPEYETALGDDGQIAYVVYNDVYTVRDSITPTKENEVTVRRIDSNFSAIPNQVVRLARKDPTPGLVVKNGLPIGQGALVKTPTFIAPREYGNPGTLIQRAKTVRIIVTGVGTTFGSGSISDQSVFQLYVAFAQLLSDRLVGKYFVQLLFVNSFLDGITPTEPSEYEKTGKRYSGQIDAKSVKAILYSETVNLVFDVGRVRPSSSTLYSNYKLVDSGDPVYLGIEASVAPKVTYNTYDLAALIPEVVFPGIAALSKYAITNGQVTQVVNNPGAGVLAFTERNFVTTNYDPDIDMVLSQEKWDILSKKFQDRYKYFKKHKTLFFNDSNPGSGSYSQTTTTRQYETDSVFSGPAKVTALMPVYAHYDNWIGSPETQGVVAPPGSDGTDPKFTGLKINPETVVKGDYQLLTTGTLGLSASIQYTSDTVVQKSYAGLSGNPFIQPKASIRNLIFLAPGSTVNYRKSVGGVFTTIKTESIDITNNSLNASNKLTNQLIKKYGGKYHWSYGGEINSTKIDIESIIQKIEKAFQ